MALRVAAVARGGFGRRRLIFHAWIKVPRHRPVPCTVIHWSVNRALIAFRESAPAAHGFKLQIEGGEEEINCEVYYRKPMILGVRFIAM